MSLFQSTTQIPVSELPEWIDHERFTRTRCPLRISRKTHPDNVPSTFSCRLHWEARQAGIEVLATQAVALSDAAKRIPVVADITLLRAFHAGSAVQPAHAPPTLLRAPHSGSAAQPAHSPPTWGFLLCFTQMSMSRSGPAFPPFASTVLEYMGRGIHHPHQISK